MWTVSSDVSIQRYQWQPLSVQPKMWMMCEGWPHHRSLRPLLFSNRGVGSFTYHKNQISASAWDGTYGFSPGGGGTQRIFVRGGSARGPTSYPFTYHFWRKRYPFCIPSIDKWYPFNTPCLELCISFNCCKCTVFWIEINHKNRTFSLLYKATKIFC